GVGYTMSAPLLDEVYCFELPDLYPLRRLNGPKYEPIYLGGRLAILTQSIFWGMRWLRSARPDVIHVHEHITLAVAYAAMRGMKVPCVLQLQGAYGTGGWRCAGW